MPNIKTIKILLIVTSIILIFCLMIYFLNEYMNREEEIPIKKIKTSSNINGENGTTGYIKAELTEMDINAKEIEDLIEKEWVAREVSIGTKESSYEDYDIYFDEGIETKTIIGKIFNIIFTNKYKDNIINNINVNTSLKEIIEILGEPTFGSIEEKILGYKGNDIYIFFSNEEISVYRIEKDDNRDELIAVFKEFEEDEDVWKLGNALTDIWADYDKYNYDTNYVDLVYTLKGLRLQYNFTTQNGITIFNNYIGNITEGNTIQNLLQDESIIPEYIFIEPNQDLVYENEKQRIEENKYKYAINMPEGEDAVDTTRFTDSFKVFLSQANGGYKNIKFLSITKEYPNSELMEELVINSYLWYGSNIFLYGVTNKGIYAYDCITRNTKELVKGNEIFLLKNLSKNILKYDSKELEVNF